MSWTWAKATNKERGEWVRGNFAACLGSKENLRNLFFLTEEGAQKILDGDDWRPEYEDGSAQR